ncbi:MAG: GNAT family N-acetyltransferase [bacterium]|nr:GNAT family N-acetyltransferase [bacterium]
MVIETERLIIRRATVEDVDLFFSLWTDPEVMTNVGFPQGLRTTRDNIRRRIERQGASEFDELLVVELKLVKQPLGECFMHAPNDEGVASTDVKLIPSAWGNKFGIEIKRALLTHLFANTDCVAVEATPNKENVASIRMQEAVGGVRISEGTFEFPPEMSAYTAPVHHYVYRVERATWAP